MKREFKPIIKDREDLKKVVCKWFNRDSVELKCPLCGNELLVFDGMEITLGGNCWVKITLDQDVYQYVYKEGADGTKYIQWHNYYDTRMV